jgi:RNA polymerase sigma factor (TIGR02999 family)
MASSLRETEKPRCEMMKGEVTLALDALGGANPLAVEELLPLVYQDLRRLARRKMSREAPGNTLGPTALVHEAYLRLVSDGSSRGWVNRGHFYAAAAEAMRRILIEAARRKSSLKRGGAGLRVELTETLAGEPTDPDGLLALDEALKKLEGEDPESHRVVILRYFGGLGVEETAAALGISSRTAKRNWSFARAWLRREMERS